MADDLSGIDFSQYGKWEQIQAPTGAIYYVIPGTGYVYDPFLSQAKGRPVIWQNPKPSVDAKKKQDDEIKKQQDQQEYANSPQGQLTPVLGGVAGLVGGTYLVNQLAKPEVRGMVDGNFFFSDGSTKPINGAAAAVKPQVNNTPPPATPTEAFAGGGNVATPQGVGATRLPGQPNVVGASNLTPVQTIQMPDGTAGTLMSDGTKIGADGTVISPNGTKVQGTTVVDASGQEIPTGSADYTQAIQGALGVWQAYQGYRQIKDGDTTGGAINLGAGAMNAGAALGSQTAATYVPGVNIAAGLYGGYQTAKYQADAPAGGQRDRNSAVGGATAGAALGAGVGSIVPGIGTVIGAGVGAVAGGLAGFAGSKFGSSKNKYQMIRDQGREGLVEAGILDSEYQGTLADGSKFDFGRDGKGLAKLDYKDPTTGEIIAMANVLASGEGLYGRPREAMAELYTNAALSNAGGDYNKALANIRHFAEQRGLTAQNTQEQIDKNKEALHEGEYEAFSNGTKTLFAGQPVVVNKPPTPPGGNISRNTGPAPMNPQTSAFLGGSKLATSANLTSPFYGISKGTPAAVGTSLPAGALPPSTPVVPAREVTRSPGIALDGHRMTAAEIGAALAKKANDRNARR